MNRLAPLLLMASLLAACQTAGHPRPFVPPGATADEENRIMCRQPRSSTWYVPCNDRFD